MKVVIDLVDDLLKNSTQVVTTKSAVGSWIYNHSAKIVYGRILCCWLIIYFHQTIGCLLVCSVCAPTYKNSLFNPSTMMQWAKWLIKGSLCVWSDVMTGHSFGHTWLNAFFFKWPTFWLFKKHGASNANFVISFCFWQLMPYLAFRVMFGI